MERRKIAPRENWKEIAEKHGFFFHHVNGDIYWDESACYAFTLKEIEKDLEDPAQELYGMCLDLVDEASRDEEIMERLRIPAPFRELASESWKRRDPSLYGRFDFSYDGKNPAKLLEFNADTPTSLYESAYFQWLWLEDVFPGCDQFNSIQEKLIEALARFHGQGMHFASVKGTEEDRATVEYIMDCAIQAGVSPEFTYMENIGLDCRGNFLDAQDQKIRRLFKLYPWEYFWTDEYADALVANCKRGFQPIEPAWKMILSSKGLLPLLWERHPNHPNLLPAWFGDDRYDHYHLCFRHDSMVTKPMLGREGANIEMILEGKQVFSTGGNYGREGFVCQKAAPLPDFDGNFPVMGVWIVNGQSCGLGIREDRSPITSDSSRFVPHVII